MRHVCFDILHSPYFQLISFSYLTSFLKRSRNHRGIIKEVQGESRGMLFVPNQLNGIALTVWESKCKVFQELQKPVWYSD